MQLRYFFSALIVFAVVPLHAASLSLDATPAYALAHNPALAAARFRIEEARGRLQQSGRFANPELEVEFTHNVRTPEGALSIAVMQKFPITARLRLEKAISQAQLAAAEAEVRNEECKIVMAVQMATVRILAIGGQRGLREKQLANTQEIAGFTRKRVETGEAAAVDASLLELEARQLETELLQLKVEKTALIGELRPLLGVAVGEPLEITGELAAPGNLPSAGVNPGSRADFQAAQKNAEAAQHGTALARAQKWEDLGVGLMWQRERSEDAPEGRSNDDMLGLKVSVPLPLWNDNSGRVREATAAASRAEMEVDALALSIRAEAEATRGEMTLLAQLVREMDSELLPKAAEVEERLRQSYSAGQVVLTETLRARDRRLLLQRQRLDALRDYNLARIRHAAASGRMPGMKGHHDGIKP